MSRSNNENLVNPAKKFFQWNGSKGGFYWFDKTIGEKGERVNVPFYEYDEILLLELRKSNVNELGLQMPLTANQIQSTVTKINPFRFMVLDCLTTIKGYDEPNKSGFWSNEIPEFSEKTNKLIVKNKNGTCFEGFYADLNVSGAKYCKSVYIAYKSEQGFEICNIQMMGAAVSAWMDFTKKNKDISTGAISVSEMFEDKKGETVFQVPVFKKIPAAPESEATALELDKELQKYLKLYFAKNNSAVSGKQIEPLMEQAVSDGNENLIPPSEKDDDLQEVYREHTEPPF